MRMWMVDPKLMCRQHLLGEHVEIHMLAGSLRRGKSIAGFLSKGLLAPQHMQQRHAELVIEMERRGMRHASPLRNVDGPEGTVDVAASHLELTRRCKACREKQENQNVVRDLL